MQKNSYEEQYFNKQNIKIIIKNTKIFKKKYKKIEERLNEKK
jgi:hypothetical protein